MPPTAIEIVFSGKTACNARKFSSFNRDAGKNLSASAPLSRASKHSVAVKTPGIL